MYVIDRHTGAVVLIRPLSNMPTPADARKAVRDYHEDEATGKVDKQR